MNICSKTKFHHRFIFIARCHFPRPRRSIHGRLRAANASYYHYPAHSFSRERYSLTLKREFHAATEAAEVSRSFSSPIYRAKRGESDFSTMCHRFHNFVFRRHYYHAKVGIIWRYYWLRVRWLSPMRRASFLCIADDAEARQAAGRDYSRATTVSE